MIVMSLLAKHLHAVSASIYVSYILHINKFPLIFRLAMHMSYLTHGLLMHLANTI